MPKKVPDKDPVLGDAELPLPVLITAEQPPVPVVITAPDGVTPIPIPSLGIEANTPPGASAPVPGYIPVSQDVPATSAVENPLGVVVAETTAIPVAVTLTAAVPPPPPTTVTKGEGTTLSPTTTEAEDTTTEGQRKVNLIWELTQAGISVLITAAVVYCAIYSISSDNLANAFFLIIGFYFSRTNHQAIGGIGTKPTAPYIGRVI